MSSSNIASWVCLQFTWPTRTSPSPNSSLERAIPSFLDFESLGTITSHANPKVQSAMFSGCKSVVNDFILSTTTSDNKVVPNVEHLCRISNDDVRVRRVMVREEANKMYSYLGCLIICCFVNSLSFLLIPFCSRFDQYCIHREMLNVGGFWQKATLPQATEEIGENVHRTVVVAFLWNFKLNDNSAAPSFFIQSGGQPWGTSTSRMKTRMTVRRCPP